MDGEITITGVERMNRVSAFAEKLQALEVLITSKSSHEVLSLLIEEVITDAIETGIILPEEVVLVKKR